MSMREEFKMALQFGAVFPAALLIIAAWLFWTSDVAGAVKVACWAVALFGIGLIGAGLGWIVERRLERLNGPVQDIACFALLAPLLGCTAFWWWAEDLARAGMPEWGAAGLAGGLFGASAVYMVWRMLTVRSAR